MKIQSNTKRVVILTCPVLVGVLLSLILELYVMSFFVGYPMFETNIGYRLPGELYNPGMIGEIDREISRAMGKAMFVYSPFFVLPAALISFFVSKKYVDKRRPDKDSNGEGIF